MCNLNYYNSVLQLSLRCRVLDYCLIKVKIRFKSYHYRPWSENYPCSHTRKTSRVVVYSPTPDQTKVHELLGLFRKTVWVLEWWATLLSFRGHKRVFFPKVILRRSVVIYIFFQSLCLARLLFPLKSETHSFFAAITCPEWVMNWSILSFKQMREEKRKWCERRSEHVKLLNSFLLPIWGFRPVFWEGIQAGDRGKNWLVLKLQ